MIALALAAVLVVVAVVAGEAVRRALRSGERRERQLQDLLARTRSENLEILDRFMFAAGKPWKDTADRPEPEDERLPFKPAPVAEDPVPGGVYSGDSIFDEFEADLRSPDGDSVFVPAPFVKDMLTERERLVDTGSLEVF